MAEIFISLIKWLLHLDCIMGVGVYIYKATCKTKYRVTTLNMSI